MAYPLLFSIIEHLFGTDSMSVFIFSCSISFHAALIAFALAHRRFQRVLCVLEQIQLDAINFQSD